MWPFKRKVPTLDQLPIDGPWEIRQGERDGNVVIVRSNAGYRGCGSLREYAHQVGIAVPLRSPEPTGLPSAEEAAELMGIEDTICPALEERGESVLVAIITTTGMREFVFYTRAPGAVRQRFERLRDSIHGHEIQLMIRPDKDCAVYAQLT